MNRNILFTFTIMIIAIVGLGIASAADNGTINDIEINDIDNVVVANETIDSINGIDDEVVANETADSKEDIVKLNHTIIYDTPDKENKNVNKPIGIATLEKANTQSNYELIELYFDPTYKKHNELDIEHIVPIIDEIDSMYVTGHSCKEISEYANMTPNQVQYIVDTHLIEPINCDELSYSVYTLYGTGSLKELADKIGVSQDDVYNKVLQIKSGYYGINYKKLFHARDMIALTSGHSDLVINNKEYYHN